MLEIFVILKKTFFKKKVLITGHTGFKGSWMLLLLSFLGAKVIGVSNQEVGSKSHFGLIKKNIRFKNYFVDIRNYIKLKKIIIKNFEKPKGFIARKLSSSTPDPVEKLTNIIEEKSMWQKFCL